MSAYDPKRTFATLDFTLGLLRHEALARFHDIRSGKGKLLRSSRDRSRGSRCTYLCTALRSGIRYQRGSSNGIERTRTSHSAKEARKWRRPVFLAGQY